MDTIGQRLQKVMLEKKISQTQLADAINSNQSTIIRWIDDKPSPSKTSIKKIAAVTGCSIDWLRDGKGDPFSQKKHENVLASIESPPGKMKSTSRKQEKESDWTISEMLTATTRVLESNTIYKGALASSIRAFDKAVQMEIEMEGIKADLKAMRKDNREMADRMERMEELLISLGATTQEKRDSAANS